mmetsp:Transcript_16567/g.40809  ORF Transcript_16567/g.40809 Transcript_16567/m.40809 type:complete len:542 (-) Transcript_16567:534-2159(-)
MIQRTSLSILNCQADTLRKALQRARDGEVEAFGDVPMMDYERREIRGQTTKKRRSAVARARALLLLLEDNVNDQDEAHVFVRKLEGFKSRLIHSEEKIVGILLDAPNRMPKGLTSKQFFLATAVSSGFILITDRQIMQYVDRHRSILSIPTCAICFPSDHLRKHHLVHEGATSSVYVKVNREGITGRKVEAFKFSFKGSKAAQLFLDVVKVIGKVSFSRDRSEELSQIGDPRYILPASTGGEKEKDCVGHNIDLEEIKDRKTERFSNGSNMRRLSDIHMMNESVEFIEDIFKPPNRRLSRRVPSRKFSSPPPRPLHPALRRLPSLDGIMDDEAHAAAAAKRFEEDLSASEEEHPESSISPELIELNKLREKKFCSNYKLRSNPENKTLAQEPGVHKYNGSWFYVDRRIKQRYGPITHEQIVSIWQDNSSRLGEYSMICNTDDPQTSTWKTVKEIRQLNSKYASMFPRFSNSIRTRLQLEGSRPDEIWFFVDSKNKRVGPLDQQEIRALFWDGEINFRTWVWRRDMERYARLEDTVVVALHP